MKTCDECHEREVQKKCRVCERELCQKCFGNQGNICNICLVRMEQGKI